MDANELIVLRADIDTQMALIQVAFERLAQRANDLDPDNLQQLESVGYQLHNLYTAAEDLLQVVAAHFENHIADTARWHSALLQRMARPIPGVRPPLLSPESQELLDALRGFRHFFRHAYSATIDFVQLENNLVKAQQLRPLLLADVAKFLEQLASTS